jgi:GWxTD domain-containing protein
MQPAAAAVLMLLLAPAPAQKQRPRAEARDLHFKKWLQEDVGYIITPEERSVFQRLTTVAEQEQFIEQFWARRDHYRRIAHANDHFKSAIDGWATDRGRIYIVFGAPTSVERHPTGGTYIRPLAEGGGITDTYPFEVWHYADVPGLGRPLDLEFVDPTQTGEYRMAVRETDKDALFMTPGLGPTALEDMGLESRAGRIRSSDAMRNLGLQGDTQGAHPLRRAPLRVPLLVPHRAVDAWRVGCQAPGVLDRRVIPPAVLRATPCLMGVIPGGMVTPIRMIKTQVYLPEEDLAASTSSGWASPRTQ